jgi:hypothetical protein
MNDQLLTQTEVAILLNLILDDVDAHLMQMIRKEQGNFSIRQDLLNQLDVLSIVRDKTNARLEYRNPLDRTD